MSENILIGKQRKTGKWVFIVDPSENYDAHLKAYQKVANGIPVNEEYTRVLCGRVQNTSTALTLITADENKKRLELLEASSNAAANAGLSAVERQKKLAAQAAADVNKTHEEKIAEKNQLVAKIKNENKTK